jgi:Flp pilus assembly pilin Flp
MIKKIKNKNSQRGAALVEAALTIALIGVTAIQAIGALGQGAADQMCDNASKVHLAESEWTSAKYFFDKVEKACCTATQSANTRIANGGPPSCLPP